MSALEVPPSWSYSQIPTSTKSSKSSVLKSSTPSFLTGEREGNRDTSLLSERRNKANELPLLKPKKAQWRSPFNTQASFGLLRKASKGVPLAPDKCFYAFCFSNRPSCQAHNALRACVFLGEERFQHLRFPSLFSRTVPTEMLISSRRSCHCIVMPGSQPASTISTEETSSPYEPTERSAFPKGLILYLHLFTCLSYAVV